MPKLHRQRCSHLIHVSKKWRRCKNKVYLDGKCSKHYKPYVSDIGTCFVCHEACNPCSQTCGRCARDLTMYCIGWK